MGVLTFISMLIMGPPSVLDSCSCLSKKLHGESPALGFPSCVTSRMCILRMLISSRSSSHSKNRSDH